MRLVILNAFILFCLYGQILHSIFDLFLFFDVVDILWLLMATQSR